MNRQDRLNKWNEEDMQHTCSTIGIYALIILCNLLCIFALIMSFILMRNHFKIVPMTLSIIYAVSMFHAWFRHKRDLITKRHPYFAYLVKSIIWDGLYLI